MNQFEVIRLGIKFNEVADNYIKEHRGSAWARGVVDYMFELLELNQDTKMIESFNNAAHNKDIKEVEKVLLNGADDWSAYSWGGSSLIYDGDICKRLCTPSEQKARRGGEWNPNKNECWLDVQRRALYQAANLIKRAIKEF